MLWFDDLSMEEEIFGLIFTCFVTLLFLIGLLLSFKLKDWISLNYLLERNDRVKLVGMEGNQKHLNDRVFKIKEPKRKGYKVKSVEKISKKKGKPARTIIVAVGWENVQPEDVHKLAKWDNQVFRGSIKKQIYNTRNGIKSADGPGNPLPTEEEEQTNQEIAEQKKKKKKKKRRRRHDDSSSEEDSDEEDPGYGKMRVGECDCVGAIECCDVSKVCEARGATCCVGSTWINSLCRKVQIVAFVLRYVYSFAVGSADLLYFKRMRNGFFMSDIVGSCYLTFLVNIVLVVLLSLVFSKGITVVLPVNIISAILIMSAYSADFDLRKTAFCNLTQLHLRSILEIMSAILSLWAFYMLGDVMVQYRMHGGAKDWETLFYWSFTFFAYEQAFVFVALTPLLWKKGIPMKDWLKDNNTTGDKMTAGQDNYIRLKLRKFHEYQLDKMMGWGVAEYIISTVIALFVDNPSTFKLYFSIIVLNTIVIIAIGLIVIDYHEKTALLGKFQMVAVLLSSIVLIVSLVKEQSLLQIFLIFVKMIISLRGLYVSFKLLSKGTLGAEGAEDDALDRVDSESSDEGDPEDYNQMFNLATSGADNPFVDDPTALRDSIPTEQVSHGASFDMGRSSSPWPGRAPNQPPAGVYDQVNSQLVDVE